MRRPIWWAVGFALLIGAASRAGAQTTKVGSTLRFGSGLIDVPVASVLPHLGLAVTYSGFKVSVDPSLATDEQGDPAGFGPPFRQWLSDGSVALGLFDRAEVGVTFQDFGGGGEGSLLGAFGRVALLRPEAGGLGVAAGVRYVRPSGVSGSRAVQPGRLGYLDGRLVEDFGSSKSRFETAFSPYLVATASLRGPTSNLFPAYDLTLSLGVGGGTFSEGADLPFYSKGNSDGWFVGSALHVGLGEARLLNLLGEYNGFEVNAGLQLDWGGVRVGGFILGLNYGENVSTYLSRKYGVQASFALCPTLGGLCRGTNHLLERPSRDVMVLPAPPPDTVRIEVAGLPTGPEAGVPLSLCLSTGEEVRVRVTAAGDTLVGPGLVSRSAAGSALVFAGVYGGDRPWFVAGDPLEFAGGQYSPAEEGTSLSCPDIRRQGDHDGVPLFVLRREPRIPGSIYVPARPGIWVEYRRRP